MKWTPKQQGIYRRLVSGAWKKNALAHGIAEKDKAEKERWYRRMLHAELSVWTTKELGQNDFAKACAAFEAIIGDSYYWTLRALGGTDAERKRRLLHQIAEECRKADVDEDYARGIARQSLQSDTTPLLEQLTPEQLATVLIALKIHVRRMGPEHDAAEPTAEELAAAGVTEGDPW